MTTATMRKWTPRYVRLAPRWHDGPGRLLDLGSVFDLRLPVPAGGVDAEAMAEDLLMVRQDLNAARAQLALES
jgi:hypothetical protein